MEKKIKWKSIALLLTLVLIAVISSIGTYVFLEKDKNIETSFKSSTVKDKVEEDKIEEYSFTFIGVGDALLHDGVYNDANTYKIGSDGYNIYDFTKMFTYIKDMISGYDVKFYNQETVIGGKNLGLSNYPCFNSPDEIGLDLVNKVGFNVVNLATNHTMDKGTTGATYSANFWKNFKDAYAVGSYTSTEDRNAVVIKEVNGIKYTMLSYTYGTNGISVPSGYEYLVNVWPTETEYEYEAYKEQVKKDIAAVRDKVDVLMVSMHWGIEYTHTPTSYQKDAAKFLSEQGVDVIIGTHPHVIQPIEYVGNTLVIYSLGNFISAQADTNTRVGMAAAFTVNKTVDKDNVKITIDDPAAELLWTYREGFSNFKIIPFSKLNDSLLPGYQSIYNQYSPIITEYDKNIKIGV